MAWIRGGVLGFEPFEEPLDGNVIRVVKQWEDVITEVGRCGRFGTVFCFEVFEHLTADAVAEALLRIHDVVRNDGKVIISVPVEVGLPALVKGVLRHRVNDVFARRYSWSKIFKSFLGIPVERVLHSPGYLEHLGFYYKDFEKVVGEKFIIEKRWFSPFGGPLSQINSQVFYSLTPR